MHSLSISVTGIDFVCVFSSLNREKREKELLRVSKENRAILDRITKSEPQYQVQRWHEDWQRAEKYMISIARYPPGWYKSHNQKVALDFWGFFLLLNCRLDLSTL